MNRRYDRPNRNNVKNNSFGKDNNVSKQREKRRLPILLVIAIDVLIAALALLIFSLYYFILPRDLSQDSQVLPEASQTEDTNTEGSSTTDTEVSWSTKFADKFTKGEVEKTENSYKSANVNISIEKVQEDDVTYYVADIYIADIKYFKTAFAKDTYGKGYHEGTDTIAENNDAIIAINGDYYANNAGIVIRNGVLYRDEIYKIRWSCTTTAACRRIQQMR
ncbi:MAG: hypothetical protein R2876_05900 [Eubacteriales bacterium]